MEPILLALSPALAFWAMNFRPIAQNGFIDPFIYTGYINNFVDLFQRYGVTYYGVRFGLLAPAELAAAAFGPVGGYFALRYAYALLAGVPFYVLVRQRFGQSAAVAALCLLLTSPYFARTLLWDHPDASGVPLLFAAVCCFLIEHRRRWLLDWGAGALAALAIHSNIFAVAPIGLFAGCWTLLSLLWRRGARPTFAPLAALVGGVALVTALVAAYYRLRVGVTDMFSVTINKSLELANGGMLEWRTPGADWVTGAWHVLTPVALALLALFVWSRRRVAFTEAVMWMCAVAATTFFYAVQFLFNGNSLELFYYFSYLLPFVFLLVSLIIGSLFSTAGTRSEWPSVVIVVSAAIAPGILWSIGKGIWYPTDVAHYLVALGISTAALILWRALPRLHRLMLPCAMATLGFMLFISFSTPVYTHMIDSRVRATRSELDIYRVAVQLIEKVPRWSSSPGAVGFWYSNEPPDSPIRSIQSTYLLGYSRVQGQGRGMPILEPADLERLARLRLRWLVLLADKRSDLALGRDALRHLAIEHKLMDGGALSSRTYGLYFEILELGGWSGGVP